MGNLLIHSPLYNHKLVILNVSIFYVHWPLVRVITHLGAMFGILLHCVILSPAAMPPKNHPLTARTLQNRIQNWKYSLICGTVFGKCGGIGIWFFGKVGGNTSVWLWQVFMAFAVVCTVVVVFWDSFLCWAFALFSPCTCRLFFKVSNSELRLRSLCCRWTASFEDDASAPPIKTKKEKKLKINRSSKIAGFRGAEGGILWFQF